jgi:inner membrane protein
MLLKTHLAFALLLILIFVNHVNDKIIFIGLVIIATIIPDLDTGFSNIGKRWIFKPLQLFVKHRGIIHSLTTAIILSSLFAYFWPVGALGFFLGYSVHILLDSFTKDGIQPFWPLKHESKGFIRSGGKFEESMFLFLIIIDLVLFLILFVF